MPQPYPNPSINQSLDVMTYANTVTGGLFGTLFAIVCTVVLFLIMKHRGYRTSDSMLVGLLLSFILNTFLWAVHIVAGHVVVVLLLLTVAAGLYSVFDSS